MRRLSLLAASCLALTATVIVPAGPFGLSGPGVAHAQSAGKGPSGLPLPRFVSLKATRVNLRIGPGRDYAVAWLYTRPGVPMEVIQEYDNWRRVRDAEGTEGWVYQSLLSGDRTATVAPWKAASGQEEFINRNVDRRWCRLPPPDRWRRPRPLPAKRGRWKGPRSRRRSGRR
jgi:SH3-like domain-containing protein